MVITTSIVLLVVISASIICVLVIGAITLLICVVLSLLVIGCELLSDFIILIVSGITSYPVAVTFDVISATHCTVHRIFSVVSRDVLGHSVLVGVSGVFAWYLNICVIFQPFGVLIIDVVEREHYLIFVHFSLTFVLR
jgi:hypothetical protein